jgi:DnaJ-class molecular chaperone
MILLKVFTLLPSAGVTPQVRKMTAKKKSHRFQMARPATYDPSAGGDLHATVVISPYEALVGTRKLVNIPTGFQRRTYRVSIPPGIQAGKQLRLRGQGRPLPDGGKGDLFLKVVIQ